MGSAMMLLSLLPGTACTAATATKGMKIAISSPRLIDPADLSGEWVLTAGGEGAGCRLRFAATPVSNGYALEADKPCLARLGVDDIAFWRPGTDGIGLANGEGRTMIFLSRETPDRYRGNGPGGASRSLIRRPPAR